MRLGSTKPDDVEQRDAAAGLVEGQAVERHGRGNQVGDADRGRAGPQEQETLIAQLAAGDPQGALNSREDHAGRALDVVVEAAHPVAIPRQEAHGIDAGPVLEVEAATREDLLDRLHELLDELVSLGGPDARLSQSQDTADRSSNSWLLVPKSRCIGRRYCGGTPAQAV